MKRKYGALFYIGYVFGWALAIVVGGSLAGAVLFPIIGKTFGSSHTIGELAFYGLRYIAEWTAKVWALSIAIVLAFNHAYRHRPSRKPTAPAVTPEKVSRNT